MPSNGSTRPSEEPDLKQFYCTKCGRVTTRINRDFHLWLIGIRVDDPAKLVVRCPQHITERTLRYAGRKRAKKNYRWARKVRETDPYPDLVYDVAHPMPLPETGIVDWYEPGKLVPALRRLNGVTAAQARERAKGKKRTL